MRSLDVKHREDLFSKGFVCLEEVDMMDLNKVLSNKDDKEKARKDKEARRKRSS